MIQNPAPHDKTPLDYAREACDMMMRRWQPEDLPPKHQFHYHQGVFLSGMEKTYRLCRDEKYMDYIKRWVDSIISNTGDITQFNAGQLDDLQPGILLFPLYERTGDRRYREAMDTIAHYLRHHPTCENGGMWHKAWYRYQMWLDGLYMAGPFMMQYATTFHERLDPHEPVRQAQLMEQVTRDAKTGLWYHAWSENRRTPWANTNTGCSPEFWGRSMGWVPVALLDEWAFITGATAEEEQDRQELARIATSLLMALLPYQDESGLWYQVVDKGDDPRNWLETSCTCLYAAGLMKAVRLGLLEKEYLKPAWKAYRGVMDRLTYGEGGVEIGGVCIGTGVGDYQHYLNRPTSVNDLHGVGAYLLMCVEAAQVPEVDAK